MAPSVAGGHGAQCPGPDLANLAGSALIDLSTCAPQPIIALSTALSTGTLGRQFMIVDHVRSAPIRPTRG